MKKIGIVADIHSNFTAFKAALDHMPRVDRIICAGDLVGYGGQPNEVVDLVRSKNIQTILGEHDYAASTQDTSLLDLYAKETISWTSKKLSEKNLEFLKNLQKSEEFSEEEREIYMTHGSPRDPLSEYVYPETSNQALVKLTQKVNADVIVLGHTHMPMNRMIQGKLIINPGSIGQPRDRNPDASYTILKLGRKIDVKNERTSYDVTEAAEKIKEAGLSEKVATRLHFGW